MLVLAVLGCALLTAAAIVVGWVLSGTTDGRGVARDRPDIAQLAGWTWFLLSTIAFGGRSLRLGEPVERIAATTGDLTDERTYIDQREETSA